MSTQAPSTSPSSSPTIAMFSYLAVLAVALVPALAAPLDGFVARQTPAGTTLHPNGDLTRCLSAATSVVAGEPGARITMCVDLPLPRMSCADKSSFPQRCMRRR